ncbi:resuscitation-promoting factor [Thermomonospora umbrina]|uniref:Surface rod structure-forming protein G n=1 Tax=Thermomonospora umbrina TaxID=111806 RepID=A0A3D9SJS2_9ACTN|nr:resuscitation-promoting factor [Thermomonospora umbrina]REE96188.1 surface rod structure-forming protein G [Thermomonospora umbrina]
MARRTPAIMTTVALVATLSSACGGGGDERPPAADAPKATVSTPPPRPVVIIVDGRSTNALIRGRTVREALTEARVPLGRHYLTKPGLDEAAGDKIKVLRLLSRPVSRTVKIEPEVVEKKRSSLGPWSEKVLQKGRSGRKIVQIAYVRRKGKKVKAVVGETVVRKPVSRIVAVGPRPSSVGGTAAGLNWPGLAKCESGGNPQAVNSAGGYYGLYQFSLQTWGSVGGTGLPSQASSAEQTYRAQLLYNKVGGRWQGQWPHCGRYLFG